MTYSNPMPEDNDQIGIMKALGPAVAALLREAVDTGVFRYQRSRSLDPEAHVDYTKSTQANMLVDRITGVVRELAELYRDDDDSLWWNLSSNKRATQLFYDPYFAVRIKRGRASRGGTTASYPTERQILIKAPRSCGPQLLIPFYGKPAIDEVDRRWLTVAFDMDELEETLAEVWIGVELETKFLWKEALPEADADIIASISPVLADRITELQALRSA